MTQLVVNMDQFDNLVEAVLDLDYKIRKLESDIYDIQRENTELRRRVDNLESITRMPPF